eukprot:TRINITY_DN18773_c0_g1_i1.p3 TRINITY_DN18773_c0_g1~~TRINITY_DN18773_c0_g1_i1.p3  ORF type:complete len:109 (+),score=38.90 TRINITY_DN18773_c0_g1_i1:70-396(+)
MHQLYSSLVVTVVLCFFFFNDTATTEIYTLHIVGSVRCVQETEEKQNKKGKEETKINCQDERNVIGKGIDKEDRNRENRETVKMRVGKHKKKSIKKSQKCKRKGDIKR